MNLENMCWYFAAGGGGESPRVRESRKGVAIRPRGPAGVGVARWSGTERKGSSPSEADNDVKLEPLERPVEREEVDTEVEVDAEGEYSSGGGSIPSSVYSQSICIIVSARCCDRLF